MVVTSGLPIHLGSIDTLGTSLYGIGSELIGNTASLIGGGKKRRKRRKRTKRKKLSKRRTRRAKGKRTRRCNCKTCKCNPCKCTKRSSRRSK